MTGISSIHGFFASALAKPDKGGCDGAAREPVDQDRFANSFLHKCTQRIRSWKEGELGVDREPWRQEDLHGSISSSEVENECSPAGFATYEPRPHDREPVLDCRRLTNHSPMITDTGKGANRIQIYRESNGCADIFGDFCGYCVEPSKAFVEQMDLRESIEECGLPAVARECHRFDLAEATSDSWGLGVDHPPRLLVPDPRRLGGECRKALADEVGNPERKVVEPGRNLPDPCSLSLRFRDRIRRSAFFFSLTPSERFSRFSFHDTTQLGNSPSAKRSGPSAQTIINPMLCLHGNFRLGQEHENAGAAGSSFV